MARKSEKPIICIPKLRRTSEITMQSTTPSKTIVAVIVVLGERQVYRRYLFPRQSPTATRKKLGLSIYIIIFVSGR